MTRTKRLVGYMWHCSDETCPCVQPVIEEVWCLSDQWEGGDPEDREHMDRMWEGTFYGDPSSNEYGELQDELREAAERHGLEEIGFEPDYYEREFE